MRQTTFKTYPEMIAAAERLRFLCLGFFAVIEWAVRIKHPPEIESAIAEAEELAIALGFPHGPFIQRDIIYGVYTFHVRRPDQNAKYELAATYRWRDSHTHLERDYLVGWDLRGDFSTVNRHALGEWIAELNNAIDEARIRAGRNGHPPLSRQDAQSAVASDTPAAIGIGVTWEDAKAMMLDYLEKHDGIWPGLHAMRRHCKCSAATIYKACSQTPKLRAAKAVHDARMRSKGKPLGEVMLDTTPQTTEPNPASAALEALIADQAADDATDNPNMPRKAVRRSRTFAGDIT